MTWGAATGEEWAIRWGISPLQDVATETAFWFFCLWQGDGKSLFGIKLGILWANFQTAASNDSETAPFHINRFENLINHLLRPDISLPGHDP